MVLRLLLSSFVMVSIFLIDISFAKQIDCDNELLSTSIDSKITIKDFLLHLSNYCSKSLIVKDALAKNILNDELFGINIIDLSLNEILDLILKDKDLYYTYKDDIIRVSGLSTKTFRVDYVNSSRDVESSTDISLSANQSMVDSTKTKMEAGSKISSQSKFDFWSNTLVQITNIATTAQDDYNVTDIVLNAESGLLTITATKKQLQRVQEYLDMMMSRLHKQVLIDVNILYVILNDTQTTGIDWTQFFSKSLSVNFDYSDNQIDSTLLSGISGNFTLTNVIDFLKTVGDVSSISNPKILTLNNQPALISSGEEIFYKTTSTITTNGDNANTESDESIESIFAGVLLDITPAITDDDKIILKINPSISTLKNPNESITGTRTIPPDLLRKQLSSVVKLANGEKVILGGLIEKTSGTSSSKIPILGNIPLFGIPFRYDENINETKELVIVITPYIVGSKISDVSLKTLGYRSTKNDKQYEKN